MRRLNVALIIALVTMTQVMGQDRPEHDALDATLGDLSWMEGSWYGEGLGGTFEEHWTGASGGTMIGAFRLVVDDKLRISEFLMLTGEAQRIVYRFKHFQQDYTTWEQDGPLEFTLVSVSDHEAVFHSEVAEQHSPRRLTYHLTGEHTLTVTVEGSDESGQLTDGFSLDFVRK